MYCRKMNGRFVLLHDRGMTFVSDVTEIVGCVITINVYILGNNRGAYIRNINVRPVRNPVERNRNEHNATV